jgi:hypothetical protein
MMIFIPDPRYLEAPFRLDKTRLKSFPKIIFCKISTILCRRMTTLSPDTHPKAEQVQIELLRRAPVWRKLQMVAQLNETVRTFALSGLRQRHPGASDGELRRLLADLILGESLAAQVYGQIKKQPHQD